MGITEGRVKSFIMGSRPEWEQMKPCMAGGGGEEEDVWTLEVFIRLKSRREERQRLGSSPLRVSNFCQLHEYLFCFRDTGM